MSRTWAGPLGGILGRRPPAELNCSRGRLPFGAVLAGYALSRRLRAVSALSGAHR